MKIVTETLITLSLTQEEARWLKGIVQNPIATTLEEEHPQDREIRKSFWDALAHIC
jgi:hypothetical protein